MSERPPGAQPAPTGDPLEAQLRALGPDVAFPATPDLVAAVRAAITPGGAAGTTAGAHGAGRAGRPRPVPSRRRRMVRTLLLAAALVIVLAATAAAAFVVLRGLQVIRVDTPPPAAPVTPGPGPAGDGLDLGRAVDPATAEVVAGFAPLTPVGVLPDGTPIGAPDATWVSTAAGTSRIALVWAARDGLPAAPETGIAVLGDQLRGATNEILVAKLAGPETEVEVIALADGTPAYWVTGGPHTVAYETPGGRLRESSGRLAADTLVFNRGDLLVRVETAAGRATALAIADALP